MKCLCKCKTVTRSLANLRMSILYRNISGINSWNEDLSTSTKHKIEKHWKEKFASKPLNDSQNYNNKYYILSMFPYPSGHLHMGHVRVYTISDSVARFQRMNGKKVIHPIGWDAFGLPAENAAIEHNIAPEVWTNQNISHMKLQLQQLGCSFDWQREIATCDSKYYQWTQELFLKLYDAGLAYQKQALVNWDPIDQTVLADEQVDENGCSWRSGAKVERKLLKQWFIRTTAFAKALQDGLNDPTLQDWRDIIKIQKNWIGDCNGVAFDFPLKTGTTKDFITLWTKTPEYLELARFIGITEKHILASTEGICLAGRTRKLNLQATNPITGETLPIFVTDQVEFLPETDSYLGIPVMVVEDQNFAQNFNIAFENLERNIPQAEIIAKQQEICEKAKKLKMGGYWTSPKLRDWLISRQRYWGTPIPIIHCDNCGPQAVPRRLLPVELPKLQCSVQKGASQLAECTDWLNTHCPKCNQIAKRETDTMDTFVDSSWYYLRYIDPNNNGEMFSVERAKQTTPVDLYVGGKEHATLHLYYARFVSHFLHFLGLLPEREPFKRLLVQGMVMGRSYRIKGSGEYVAPKVVDVIDLKRNKATHKQTGQPVVMAWEKMSKSKHNGIDPTDMFQEYGIDTTRLLILADVAPTSHRNWNSNTFPGVINWQRRLWLTVQEFIKYRQENIAQQLPEDKFKAHNEYMFDSRNFYAKGATFNYAVAQQLSVAISKMQGLTNSLRGVPPAVFAHSLQFERALACQIILLAPMAPHFASELWSGFVLAPNRLNNSGEIQWNKTVLEQAWPVVDLDYNLDLVCQINGCDHSVVKMPRREIEKLSKEEAVAVILGQKDVQEALVKRKIEDVLYTLIEGYEGVVNILTRSRVVCSENKS